MFKFARLLVFIIAHAYLIADPNLPGVVAATEGDPGSIAAGCVNVITGDLVLGKEDLVVRGAVPLPLSRSYASGNGKAWDGNCGWHFFFPHFIMRFEDMPEQPSDAVVTIPSGTSLRFYKTKNKHPEMRPYVRKHAVGMANNSSGIISARTNFKNARIFFQDKKKGLSDVVLFTPEGLHCYYESFKKHSSVGIHEFVLLREEMTNGCWILYEHDKYGRPTLAKVVNPSQNKVFSWARFHWEGSNKENHNVRIETSDGRELRYTFERRKGKESEGSYRYYLQSVSGSLAAEENTSFAAPPKDFNSLLTEARIGGQLFQKISYLYPEKHGQVKNKDDLRCNRVKELIRPVGPKGEEVCTHRFTYPKIKWKDHMACCESGGTGVVEGPHGLKATYEWTRELRPSWIRHYDLEESSYPRIMHELVWSPENNEESGNLASRGLLDKDGRYLWIKSYTYDDRHNPITETFRGNLTGSYSGHFAINDCKLEGGETYTHHYTYSSDGRNLLLEDREDNGRITRYQYLPGTSLLTTKLICDAHRIWQSELYEYDGDHLLVAEIIDGGLSNSRIKRTFRRADGMPERIEERCLDDGKERILKSIFIHYTKALLVGKQDIFDANGNKAYSLTFEYDDKDRIVKETDPLGNATTYSYDHLGRLVQMVQPNGNIETITYDAANRPTVHCTKTKDGQQHIESTSYNALNHKIASIDAHGHVTRFTPDPWGRIKTIEYADGSKEKMEYNALNLPVQIVTRGGAVTHIAYNSYGKPISIKHPDGSQESFIYDHTGNLLRSKDKLGTSTFLTYDLLGRVIHKKAVDHSGCTLREEHYIYRGVHLVQHVNAEGEITEFEYDAAGRKIAEHKHGTTTRFTYDALGRLSTTSSDEATLEKTYDFLDRVICEKIISRSGELHREVAYIYDCDGHILTTTMTTLQGPSVETCTFDGFGRLISKTDPLGHTTTIEWNESTSGFIRKITTDPIGTKVIETIGAMDRLISKEIRSPQNTRLSLTQYSYDAEGHCIEEEVLLPTRTIVTKRNYILGKLDTLIEAAAAPEQKITRYSYKQDLLSTVQKNDGTLLHYTYDALGRIASCVASTNEGYAYTYDRLDRITRVTDLARGLVSTRSYDPSGSINEEVLLHGLPIRYERDPLGKPITLILPDDTSIGYKWDASHLKAIYRLDAEGNILYIHTNNQFDLTGTVVSSSLIANLGTETRLFDLAHRPLKFSSPFHHHIAKSRNPMGSLLEAHSCFNNLIDGAFYSYDPLQQLKTEYSLFHKHSFQFDAHGTPLLHDDKTCKINSLNQLEESGDLHCTYTLAGNLESDGRFNYHYDAFDRLTKAEELGIQKIEYSYDAWHRRMQKVHYLWKNNQWVLSSTRSYLYDGMLEIGSTDETGTIVELRLLGQTTHSDTGSTIAIECDSHLYAPFHDLRGNISGLIDATSSELCTVYRYSAFGEVKIFDADNNPSTSSNPWRYFGKRTDEETGLILFGRRYYHTKLNTWITPDPAQTLDHSNLYLFLRNSPLNLHDALGLRADPNTFYTPPRPNIFEPTPVGLALNRAVKTVTRPIGCALYYTGHELPIPIVRDGVMFVGSALRGKWYSIQRPEHIYIPGTIDNQIYIRGNGIHTSRKEAVKGAKRESEMLDGHSVWVFYNPSKGYLLDLLDCGLEWCGVKTETARVGIEGRKAIYEDAKTHCENPTLNVRTHSEGCLLEEVINTELKTTHPEITNHTTLYALGSPKILSPTLVNTVDIRISKWDAVGWIDVVGRLQNHHHVTILEPLKSYPLADHGINGQTYLNELKQITRNIRGRN